tara:strand:+ start:369 stop:563 length:195 start_codon:yes stop_codon:yes gene_type:complete
MIHGFSILQIISIYLFVGLVFTAAVDFLISKTGDEEIQFKNIERLLSIVLWPVYLFIFILNFKR